jgi:hypothetical protein
MLGWRICRYGGESSDIIGQECVDVDGGESADNNKNNIHISDTAEQRRGILRSPSSSIGFMKAACGSRARIVYKI